MDDLQKNMLESMKLMLVNGYVPSHSMLDYIQNYNTKVSNIKSNIGINLKFRYDNFNTDKGTLYFIPSIISVKTSADSSDISNLKKMADYLITVCNICERLNNNFPLRGSLTELSDCFQNCCNLLGV